MPGNLEQLALRFPFNDRQVFESFQRRGNEEVLARLDETLSANAFAGAWLWGEPGSGITHLLNAACHRVGTRGGRAAYLPLAALERDPEALVGLEECRLVVLDDVHLWLGAADLEVELMALYQTLAATAGCLLCGANAPARQLDFALPDWRSRCAGLPSYRVHALDDVGKRALLRAHAATRGLQLSDPVLDFWLARSERSVPRLLADLERLDQAALRAGRAVTVPLVKTALGL